MSAALQVLLIIGVFVYTAIVFYMLSKKKLTLKYSLLWLFSAFVFLIIAIFPQIPLAIANLFGFQTVANALFVLIIFCILILLISLTSIVSAQSNKIKRLIQINAILEKRVDDLSSKFDQ